MTRVNSNDVCDWLIFILTRMLCWQSVLCQLLISRKVKHTQHKFPIAKIWFEFQLNDVIPLSSTAWTQPCRIPVSEEGRGQMILIHLIVSAFILFYLLNDINLLGWQWRGARGWSEGGCTPGPGQGGAWPQRSQGGGQEAQVGWLFNFNICLSLYTLNIFFASKPLTNHLKFCQVVIAAKIIPIVH